jgi:cytochrome P450
MTTPATDVDLVAPAAVRDPLAVFERLREGGDVWWLERHRAWLLLGYDLVRDAVMDERLSTDTITPLQRHLSDEEQARFKPAADMLAGWMIFNDPPVHTALRAPVRSAFTPRGVASLESDIVALVDQLLDRIDPDGFDLVQDIAYPLPAIVIALLLGVPVDRHEEFKGWSRQLGALVMGKVSRADAWDRALMAAEDFDRLFSELIARARRAPGDDLVARLVEAADDDAGGLADHQVVGACSLLLFGGHETTTSLIASGALHLLGRPDRQALLLDNPTLAVEELLRYDGPSKIVVRRVREDGDWRGHPFRAGAPVFCGLMAANHDPAAFDEPGRLVLDRDPNRHLGFGWGMHFCLGAQLARLEARVVLPRIFARFPDLQLSVAPDQLAWQPTIVGRTLRALPVRSGRR